MSFQAMLYVLLVTFLAIETFAVCLVYKCWQKERMQNVRNLCSLCSRVRKRWLPVPQRFELLFHSVESLLANQELHFISFLYLVGPRDMFSPQECE